MYIVKIFVTLRGGLVLLDLLYALVRVTVWRWDMILWLLSGRRD